MQEKEQKISPIKQRILLFVKKLDISKREFYAKIEVSRGTLESKTGITEDVICRFLKAYPEVNVDWLITGEGDMCKTKDFATHENVSIPDLISQLKEQAEEIGRLKERITTLEREKGKSASHAPTADAADAV